MSKLTSDGGPAFPTLFIEPDYGSGYAGMTLRDYFAAKAMQAIISSALSEKTKTKYNINKPDFIECLSLDAYAHADAMIKAREAK